MFKGWKIEWSKITQLRVKAVTEERQQTNGEVHVRYDNYAAEANETKRPVAPSQLLDYFKSLHIPCFFWLRIINGFVLLFIYWVALNIICFISPDEHYEFFYSAFLVTQK